MDFMTAVKKCLSEYANFEGRSRRSEFWYFTLAVAAVSFVFGVLGNISTVLGIALDVVLIVATFIPGIAVTCRRLHDIGKSGWLQLVALIPCVGWIIVIVWCCQDSMPGDNMYGPNPKE